MRFGLFYEHQLPRPWADGDEERLLLDALEQVELADRIGLDVVWEVEHHFLEEYSHSSAPEVFLAAASQRTSQIRLGHGIVQLPPAFNHPARVAERAATLDLLSGGRVELGTGEGSSQAELGGFGVSRDAKREQWSEALDVLVRAMTENPFTGHHGRYVDMPPRNVVPKPKQRPHPPLWMACSRREAVETAARKGIGALSFSFVSPEDAKPFVDSYYDILASAECVPAGLAVNPNVAVVVPLMCHRDEETAIERGIDGAHFFGYSLAHYYVFGDHRPGHTNIWEQFEAYRAERGFARELIRADARPLGIKVLEGRLGSLRGAVGTPDQVADLIERYEAVGVDQVIFVAQAGRNDHEHLCESLELFGAEVMPRFTEGRDQRDKDKAERLAPAVGAALARRPSAVGRDVSGYAITPQGEPTPARWGPPTDAGSVAEALKTGAERQVRRGLSALTGRMSDVQLLRWGGSDRALSALFSTMAKRIDGHVPPDLAGQVTYRLTEANSERTWTIRFAEGRAQAIAGAVADPDVTIRVSLVDFLRMASGELQGGEALMTERVEVDGDLGMAARFLSVLTEETR